MLLVTPNKENIRSIILSDVSLGNLVNFLKSEIKVVSGTTPVPDCPCQDFVTLSSHFPNFIKLPLLFAVKETYQTEETMKQEIYNLLVKTQSKLEGIFRMSPLNLLTWSNQHSVLCRTPLKQLR